MLEESLAIGSLSPHDGKRGVFASDCLTAYDVATPVQQKCRDEFEDEIRRRPESSGSGTTCSCFWTTRTFQQRTIPQNVKVSSSTQLDCNALRFDFDPMIRSEIKAFCARAIATSPRQKGYLI